MLLTEQETRQLLQSPLGTDIDPNLLEKLHYSAAVVQLGEQEHLNLWVEDTHFVLNQIKQLNSGDIDSNLKGIFDLSKIAASGHSFGGATARRFCNQESSCVASLNMDGSSFALIDEKIVNPHLNFYSDAEANVQAELREEDEEYSEDDIADEVESNLFEAHLTSHTSINAAQSDLFIFGLKTIDHGGFALGWGNTHDYGLGKEILHPILNQASLQFFNAYLQPEQKSAAQEKLCQQAIAEDALVSFFNNVCQ